MFEVLLVVAINYLIAVMSICVMTCFGYILEFVDD